MRLKRNGNNNKTVLNAGLLSQIIREFDCGFHIWSSANLYKKYANDTKIQQKTRVRINIKAPRRNHSDAL